MANAQGFWALQMGWQVRGKTCDIAFYIGAEAGVDTGDETVVETIATHIKTAWDDSEVTTFNQAYLQAMHLTSTTFNDFRLLFKGGIGFEALQMPLNKPVVGTRNPASDGEMLPPQNVVSCYAPRVLSLGRGAKVGFSGAVELDWSSSQWNPAAARFYTYVGEFVTAFSSFVSFVAAESGFALIPVVVQRIQTVAPSGKPSNRLPTHADDNVVTFRISDYVPSLQAGSKNKMKVKLR